MLCQLSFIICQLSSLSGSYVSSVTLQAYLFVAKFGWKWGCLSVLKTSSRILLKNPPKICMHVNIALNQTYNVRAKVRSISNFFWNHQFELIFHKYFPKTNRFASLVTKPLGKIFLEDIFQILQVFGTNSALK